MPLHFICLIKCCFQVLLLRIQKMMKVSTLVSSQVKFTNNFLFSNFIQSNLQAQRCLQVRLRPSGIKFCTLYPGVENLRHYTLLMSPPGNCVHVLRSMPGASAPEWMGFQEAEYKFFDHRTTWHQAQRICSWFQASLASVHSDNESAFLSTALRKVACHTLFAWASAQIGNT